MFISTNLVFSQIHTVSTAPALLRRGKKKTLFINSNDLQAFRRAGSRQVSPAVREWMLFMCCIVIHQQDKLPSWKTDVCAWPRGTLASSFSEKGPFIYLMHSSQVQCNCEDFQCGTINILIKFFEEIIFIDVSLLSSDGSKLLFPWIYWLWPEGCAPEFNIAS